MNEDGSSSDVDLCASRAHFSAETFWGVFSKVFSYFPLIYFLLKYFGDATYYILFSKYEDPAHAQFSFWRDNFSLYFHKS